MPVPRLYLDTSVIGGYFDDEWKDATQELWRQMEAGRDQFLTSAVTADDKGFDVHQRSIRAIGMHRDTRPQRDRCDSLFA